MSDNNEKQMRFQCPHCSVVMKGKVSNAGKEKKCPKCGGKFKVPRPKSKADTAEKKTSKATPKKRAKKREQPAIPVVCGVCATRMYATYDQIGQSIECPDCFTQNLVTKPRKKPKANAPDMSAGFSYDLEPEKEIEVTRTLGEDLLKEADAEVEKIIENEPRVIERPFVDRVYQYPFTLRIFPILLGMVLAWSLVFFMLKFAWGLQGKAASMAPVVMAVTAIFMTLVALPTLVSFQKILENTSNDDDEAECRPEGGLFSVVEWMVDCAPMLAALFVCVAPFFGVISLAQLPVQSYFVIPVVLYLFFPFVLMSILESASVTGIVSKPVWKSLRQIPGTWFKFYASTFLLAIAMTGGVAILGRLGTLDFSTGNMAAACGAMLLIIYALAVYFRLQGRLALVMSQVIMVDVVEPESNEVAVDEQEVDSETEINIGV